MAKTNEKKKITKSDWVSNFRCVGAAVVNDYTFKIDEKSEKSAWIYNALNLSINCGEKHGRVYSEMMGGYSDSGDSVIYVHGKKEDGTDDYDNRFQIDWEDRLDKDIIESVGEQCFITVGLEKDDKGNTFYNKFLSAYDAIAYTKEHLNDGDIVVVRGNLKYSTYNENVQVRKNITSIVLSKKAKEAKDFSAHFTQSVLIDSDSASLKNIDKDKGVMFIDTRILEYVKEFNGQEVKGQYPYKKTFEFPMNFENEKACKMLMSKVFKVKKGITQMTFEGDLIEGGAVVATTLDDVPDDIKDLIDCGVYTEEEALAACAENGSKEQRMLLTKPLIRLVGENKIPTIQKFEERYKEDDLYLDYLYKNKSDTEENTDNEEVDSESTSENELDWLNDIK